VQQPCQSSPCIRLPASRNGFQQSASTAAASKTHHVSRKQSVLGSPRKTWHRYRTCTLQAPPKPSDRNAHAHAAALPLGQAHRAALVFMNSSLQQILREFSESSAHPIQQHLGRGGKLGVCINSRYCLLRRGFASPLHDPVAEMPVSVPPNLRKRIKKMTAPSPGEEAQIPASRTNPPARQRDDDPVSIRPALCLRPQRRGLPGSNTLPKLPAAFAESTA